MTRDELEAAIARAERRVCDATKRAEEAEHQLAGVMAMRARDAPLWDRLGGVAKTLMGTDSAKIAEQRDRALALLRDEARWSCGYWNRAECRGDWGPDGDSKAGPVCWEHRRRALLAEFGAP